MTAVDLDALTAGDLYHLYRLKETELEREIAREDDHDRACLERLLPRMDEEIAAQIREALDQVALGLVLEMWWPSIAPLVGAGAP